MGQLQSQSTTQNTIRDLVSNDTRLDLSSVDFVDVEEQKCSSQIIDVYDDFISSKKIDNPNDLATKEIISRIKDIELRLSNIENIIYNKGFNIREFVSYYYIKFLNLFT